MAVITRLTKLFLLSMAIYTVILPVSGQITTICTTGMLSSFTPCMNYVTGSSANGNSPTSGCCESLASLMSNSAGCFCLLLMANVPLGIPINRTLAMSLPRACRMQAVPLQCKDTSVSLPPAGSVIPAPALPPLPPAAALPPVTATEADAPPPAPSTPLIQLAPPESPSVIIGTGLLPKENSGLKINGFSYVSVLALLALAIMV